MKYGIQAVRPDNQIQFCCSTRGRRGGFVDDITDTALFVQEKSAVEALRILRLEGAEADGTQLFVIEVNFTVNRLIPVERPKQKEGFVLVKNNVNIPEEYAYFIGTKTSKGRVEHWSDPNHFGNKERATVFPTEAAAHARRNALVSTAQNWKERTEKAGPRHGYGYRRTQEEVEAEFKRDMERHDKEITDMSNLKIVVYI